MTSTVKARPNHYELLGLPPNATSAEIGEAFAREVARPHAFGAVAQLGLAYEVLRDPVRRRAYDDSLGLNKPRPIAAPNGRYSLSIPPIHVDPRPLIEPREEPRLASFIASSVREPVAPAPRHDPPQPRHDPPPPQAEVQPPPQAEVQPPPLADVQGSSTEAWPRLERPAVREADDPPVRWQRPAVIAGALVLAVGMLGAWAGSQAGNDAEAQQEAQPQRAVTVPLPQAKPPTIADTSDVAAPVQFRRRLPSSSHRIEPRPVMAAEQANEPVRVLRNPPELNPTEDSVAGAAPAASEAPAVAASLPLSHAAIAHTIGRIGYSCGRVASTSAVGGSGAFTVTCTSGDSYRAAPVRGRYRFHRL